jgi:single-stranded-DNA-specific exonuclease
MPISLRQKILLLKIFFSWYGAGFMAVSLPVFAMVGYMKQIKHYQDQFIAENLQKMVSSGGSAISGSSCNDTCSTAVITNVASASNLNAASTAVLHPLLQRIYAARGVSSLRHINYSLTNLLSYKELSGIESAVDCLYQALMQQQRVLIVGDFDVDGATSTVLAILALRAFGLQNVAYLIPNRFEFGYGLTPELVEVAARQHQPEIIITVDNGITSYDGVAAARAKGIKVVITDHHLPAAADDALPVAVAIINPNKPGDIFPSKSLAGVGVVFYLMVALRSFLRAQNWFATHALTEPNMAQFLDLVALGTVADLAPLDYNNRILIHHGIARIRAGHCRLGIKTLLHVANRDYAKLRADDLAYVLAPRLNAAGRLDDMSVGVACLLSDSAQHVRLLARELDDLNKTRRTIEAGMQQQALDGLDKLHLGQKEQPAALCVFDEQWHQGVVGILASKIKDHYNCPVIAFAAVGEDEIKGSARSVDGLHLREVLDGIAAQHPNLMVKFGGHAMAAGISLRRADYDKFHTVFIDAVKQQLEREPFKQYIYTDGELAPEYFSLAIAELLGMAGPWGKDFPEPSFDGVFHVVAQRVVGTRHLKLILRPGLSQESSSSLNLNPSLLASSLAPALLQQDIDAIHFNMDEAKWPNQRVDKIRAVYRLAINEYNGRRSLQLLIDQLEPYQLRE